MLFHGIPIIGEFFLWIKITRLKKFSYLNPTEHTSAIGFQVLTKKSKFMAFLAEQAAKSRLRQDFLEKL